MMKVIERAEARYDVQEVEFGEVYKWRPESVVVECGCGKELTLTAASTACGECGADHGAVMREEPTGRQLGDEALRPWRYSEDREDSGLPY